MLNEECTEMILIGNECQLENYMSSHGKLCYKSLVHERRVYVKFNFELMNNTLPAKHETSKLLAGWAKI